jgi:trans-2-enoyl-CoA reductase
MIPLWTGFDYIHHALDIVGRSDPNLPYSKGYQLADRIVVALTCGLMQLAVKFANSPDERYYGSMKVARTSIGKLRLE